MTAASVKVARRKVTEGEEEDIDVAGREARVTGLKAISPSGCIPREINDQVLEMR